MKCVMSLALCTRCLRNGGHQLLYQGSYNGGQILQQHRGVTAEAKDVRKRKPRRMKAWHIYQYGGGEEMVMATEAKIPEIRKPKEILVEVHAASVNPIDVRMREGYGRNIINQMRKWLGGSSGSEFPLTLGRDFSGVVKQTGHGVTRFKPGDEVWGALAGERQGTHAQYCITAENEISLKPKSLSHTEAASIPYVATTNWAALVTVGELSEKKAYSKRILINGGAGGIGTFAIQLLKCWGAEVVATCSTDAIPLVKHVGADEVIDYTTQDVLQTLQAGEKLDFVLDAVGDEVIQSTMTHLKPYSKYVTIVMPILPATDNYGLLGGLAKSALDFNYNYAKGIQKGLASYRWAFFLPNGTALKKVAEYVDDGKIQPVMDKVYPLEELPEAYEKVSRNKGRGKTVVEMLT